MAETEIPSLSYTPVESIKGIHGTVNRTFLSHKTRPLSWRLTQLRKLWWGIKDNEEQLYEACKRDLGKSRYETYISEIGWVLNDIIFTCDNLEKWAKDEVAPDIPLMMAAMRPKIRKDPLGAVLVVGTYNFPIQLSLGPLVGAMSAGCTAVLKPSENAPHSAAVMQSIIESRLDPEAFTVVQGGVPGTTALLDCKWDKIFYTGGGSVGTIIAKKAAETLTPVTLELGGKNPAIVTKNADPRIAARRLLWGKAHNAGQVCVSQNYVLVDQEIMPFFIAELKSAIAEFYPKGIKESDDFSRIVNDRQFQRLKKMLDSSSGKIISGGTMDAATRFFELTVVEVSSPSDPLLAEESFGPVMPILPVKDLDEALRIANDIDSTPLGVYAFGSSADTAKILTGTRSGGASVNDGFIHGSIATLEFGGVGGSGQGSYRGKASFDCFSHRRAITYTPSWAETLMSIRYPPYAGKMKLYKTANENKPNFDRSGNVRANIFTKLLALFGKLFVGGAKNWLIVFVTILATRQWLIRTEKLVGVIGYGGCW
ncbi:hypothetical protein AAFC00_000835 [Neodothiora populina]|uniref:Aldehyde dehydrogenase n=1 Tax=Neodothiora populina TaxID=2781224 RepID=A0ABR3PM63_9PEZI